jgi:hypothetical protein
VQTTKERLKKLVFDMSCLFWFCVDYVKCNTDAPPQSFAFDGAKPQKHFQKRQMHQLWALLVAEPRMIRRFCWCQSGVETVASAWHHSLSITRNLTVCPGPFILCMGGNTIRVFHRIHISVSILVSVTLRGPLKTG